MKVLKFPNFNWSSINFCKTKSLWRKREDPGLNLAKPEMLFHLNTFNQEMKKKVILWPMAAGNNNFAKES